MPNMMNIKFLYDISGTYVMDRIVDDIANNAVRNTIEQIITDIHTNWSTVSPSSPGDPPAVVTGFLDQSIRMTRRDALGRFSTKANTFVWGLQVEADYGAALEFGYPSRGLAARPFLRPAIDKASALLGIELSIGFKSTAAIGRLTKPAFIARGLG